MDVCAVFVVVVVVVVFVVVVVATIIETSKINYDPTLNNCDWFRSGISKDYLHSEF